MVLDEILPKENPGFQIFLAHEARPGGFDDAKYFLIGLAKKAIVFLLREDGSGRMMGPSQWADAAREIFARTVRSDLPTQ